MTQHRGGEAQPSCLWYTLLEGKASELVLQETLHRLLFPAEILLIHSSAFVPWSLVWHSLLPRCALTPLVTRGK